ncbi:MAG: hypothetical protein H0X67_02070 [Acidobacteria bacterium]|nr:hypothetical protein [Acidobacteriota bacterium]
MTTAPRRTLDSYKKEAKRWRDALRSAEAAAWARLRAALPAAPRDPTLRDVQLALAREHGFSGWTALKQAVEQAARHTGAQALALYEEKAAALLEAYRTGTLDALERHYRHTWHRRAWRSMRNYVQLDLGKRPAGPDEEVEITLEDARLLVAREHGFAGWDALRAFTASLRAGRQVLTKPMRLVVRGGGDEWEPIAGSRDWDEVLDLLAAHPSAGLSAERQMTDALLADLARAERLTALGLSGCGDVTDEGIRHLARLPALEHLDLSATGITDTGLDVLRHLPRLRTLVLASDRITDAGLASLAHCDAIEELRVWVPQGGGAALGALRGKQNLRRLELALGDDEVPGLHEVPAFKTWQGGEAAFTVFGSERAPNHLMLRGRLTDRGLQQLAGLDGLFSLDIDDRRLPFTAAGMAPLASLPHLGALRVDARDDWMPGIAAIPRLQYLGIQDTVVGDDGFVALGRSRSIEYIWGGDCHNLGSRGFRALASMPALRGLSVSCRNVDDEAVALLPDFPALRELMPMGIPDAGYRHIGRCRGLERLILMYCRDTTDAATEHITGLSRLAYYFASYTLVTDRTPELLSSMDSLERITFDTCHGLTDAGVATLARLPRLRELRVSGPGITPSVRAAFPSSVSVFCEG